MNPHDVIRRPLITEKSTAGAAEGRYTFEVALHANKVQIKQAVQAIWPAVHVLKVNTAIMPGKPRRVGRSAGVRPDWKKAVVTLRRGERIEFFEGLR
jgi:large subunit ribosomal protein L23